MPRTVADLLAGLQRESGRPRLTWYGPQGERIELSGAVLDNWVAKTTNLLVEEFDLGPGGTLGLALPTHWRALVWALAAWRCGATVAIDDTATAEVLVTDHPERAVGGQDVVAVALPALSRAWSGAPLPAGAVDAAAAVMTYGDVIGWAPAVEPERPALVTAERTIAHRDLIPDATADRALLTADDPASTLLTALGVWAAGGSVVLAPGVTETERIVATEQVTAEY